MTTPVRDGISRIPETQTSGPPPTAGTGHGLTVTLPGYHTATVYTDTDDDSATIGDMLRHNGCLVAQFGYTATTPEGTYAR